MRMILFFDLPVQTSRQRNQYTRFRKFLIRNGFFMMQESVYTRIVLNSTIQKLVVESVKKNKPTDGLVQMITVTERQFSKMEYITGEKTSNVIDSDKRLIII